MAREYAVYQIKEGKKTLLYRTAGFDEKQSQEKAAFSDELILCVSGQDEAEKELAEKLDDALEANRAKESFLSNMSHDIRTPMNAIIGMTGLAKKHIDEKSRVLDSLNKIEVAGSHLLSLINEVLDMSRISSGKLTLQKEPFFLSDLLHDTLIIARPQAEEKQHRLDFTTQNISTERLVGDELRLRQIMLNIINNAIKYTNDKGHIIIRISEEPREDSVLLSFSCQDNGIGMSKQFLEHIFDPFERAGNTTVSRIEGTGLGMSIVKKLIEAMDGTIAIESEVNKGTLVSVIIPLSYEKLELDAADLKNRRLLILEDREEQQISLGGMLKEFGLRCDFVGDYSSVISALTGSEFEKDPYDAVMLVNTEDRSGSIFDIASYVKKTSPHVPIVLISEDNWEQIEYRATRSGITHFIPVPYFRKSLILGLKQAFDNSDQTSFSLEEPDLFNRNVLLVEDNMINREIAKEILSMTKAHIEIAENGQIACEMFKKSETGYYSLILMDIQMPVMDGYEATRTIRAMDRKDAKSVPIFAMTANTFAEDIAKAKQAGMNEHIAKPIDIKKLMELLHSI